MRRILLAATASLVLAACGDNSGADADGDGTISMEEARDELERADVVKPEPGKYRATVEFVDVSIPDAPQQVQDMMRGMFDRGPQTHEYCLTEEDAEKGFEEMAKRGQEDSDSCSFEKFDASGGKIDAVMNCSAEGEGTARMTLNGTGGPTSSEMTMTMNAKAPDGKTMTMTMKSSQERIGDCDA